MTRRQQNLITAAAASIAAAVPFAAEAPAVAAAPGQSGSAAELVVSPLGLDSRAENRAELAYRVLYRRAERHGTEDPGRNIVEDGVLEHGEAREASKAEIKRSIAKLRAERGSASERTASDAPSGEVSASRSSGSQASASTGSGTSASSGLEAIAACESGGDPSAVGGGGQYRGKYQFDQSTWSSVGGSGDPAAASESEQDARAAKLAAQQGSAAWPTCG